MDYIRIEAQRIIAENRAQERSNVIAQIRELTADRWQQGIGRSPLIYKHDLDRVLEIAERG